MRSSVTRGRGAPRFEAVWLCALLFAGCDDKAARQAEEAQARARATRAAEVEAERRAAEEKANAERAENERSAALHQKEELAKKAQGALSACCQALARRGFEERDMKDMAAKQVCLERQAQGDALSVVRPLVSQALGERELPPACSTEPPAP